MLAMDAMLFGVWNTEAADGVTLEPVGAGRYRLSGSKTFASGAGVVARAIVTGRLPNGGWQMCLIPMDRVTTRIDPSWWRPIGMHGSASFKVDVSGVEIGQDALIGRPGDYQRQPWFSGGAIRFAAVQLGGAEALFDAARAELRALGRDGDPHQRARFGMMAIAIESGRLWLRGAAPLVDLCCGAMDDEPVDDETSERIVGYVNMARSAIERICLDTIQLVERSVGARGLLAPHPIERIVRDLTLYLRQPVPDAALTDAGRYALESKAPSPRLWSGPGERRPSATHRSAGSRTCRSCPSVDGPRARPDAGRGAPPGRRGARLRRDDRPAPAGADPRSGGHRQRRRRLASAFAAVSRSGPARAAAAESLAGLASLGVGAEQVTFLGLPDGAVPTAASAAGRAPSSVPARLLQAWPRPPDRPLALAARPARRSPRDLVAVRRRARRDPLGRPPPRIPDLDPRASRPRAIRRVPTRRASGAWTSTGPSDRKRAAILAHQSQTTDLIDDDPTGYCLTEAVLAHFFRPWELLIEVRT